MRINKYLAHQNICSRREADKLIQEKKVYINGKLAVLGDDVSEEDKVEVRDNHKNYLYFAYHKPKGIITNIPQKGEISIHNNAKIPKEVFPIGRLDKDSSGLILLTNDGRVTKRILDPKAELEKEYLVLLDKPVTQKFIQQMMNGVVLDNGYKTKPCNVRKYDDYTIKIILTEGKKRQIRRMAEALKYQVIELMRIRIGKISLDNLQPNEWRKLKEI